MCICVLSRLLLSFLSKRRGNVFLFSSFLIEHIYSDNLLGGYNNNDVRNKRNLEQPDFHDNVFFLLLHTAS